MLYNEIGDLGTLSKLIKGVKYEEVRKWKTGKRSVPIWALLALNKLLRKQIPIDELEKNIIGYKVKSSRKIIYKPKLPLIENVKLIRTVTHLICDGYDGGKNHSPAYFNTEKILVDNFCKDLKVFGQMEITRRTRSPKEKNNRLLYITEFPKVVSYILRHIYKIQFGSKLSRLPESFFFLPKELVIQVIKSFADDESHVGESFVIFVSSNKNLLNDLKKLIELKVSQISPFLTKIKYLDSAKAYNFSLKRRGLDYFYKKINFDHPEKKRILYFLISRNSSPGNKFKEGKAKKLILKILSNKPTTSIELSIKLGIKPKNIRYHLYNLKKEGIVTDKKEETFRSKLWSIKYVNANKLHQ